MRSVLPVTAPHGDVERKGLVLCMLYVMGMTGVKAVHTGVGR